MDLKSSVDSPRASQVIAGRGSSSSTGSKSSLAVSTSRSVSRPAKKTINQKRVTASRNLSRKERRPDGIYYVKK